MVLDFMDAQQEAEAMGEASEASEALARHERLRAMAERAGKA